MVDPLKPADPSNQQLLRLQFESEAKKKAVRDTSIGARVGSILFLVFGILDYFAFPRLFETFAIIRLCFVALSMLIMSLTKTGFGRGQPFLLAILEYLIG